MKRREFIALGLAATAGTIAFGADKAKAPAAKAAGSTITEKDILRDGKPATIANFCENPDKQPNKTCPDWKTKPGHCKDCMFYNKDNSLTTFKGGKYARCQLLTDPKNAQFVGENAYCSTYTKQA